MDYCLFLSPLSSSSSISPLFRRVCDSVCQGGVTTKSRIRLWKKNSSSSRRLIEANNDSSLPVIPPLKKMKSLVQTLPASLPAPPHTSSSGASRMWRRPSWPHPPLALLRPTRSTGASSGRPLPMPIWRTRTAWPLSWRWPTTGTTAPGRARGRS